MGCCLLNFRPLSCFPFSLDQRIISAFVMFFRRYCLFFTNSFLLKMSVIFKISPLCPLIHPLSNSLGERRIKNLFIDHPFHPLLRKEGIILFPMQIPKTIFMLSTDNWFLFLYQVFSFSFFAYCKLTFCFLSTANCLLSFVFSFVSICEIRV